MINVNNPEEFIVEFEVWGVRRKEKVSDASKQERAAPNKDNVLVKTIKQVAGMTKELWDDITASREIVQLGDKYTFCIDWLELCQSSATGGRGGSFSREVAFGESSKFTLQYEISERIWVAEPLGDEAPELNWGRLSAGALELVQRSAADLAEDDALPTVSRVLSVKSTTTVVTEAQAVLRKLQQSEREYTNILERRPPAVVQQTIHVEEERRHDTDAWRASHPSLLLLRQLDACKGIKDHLRELQITCHTVLDSLL